MKTILATLVLFVALSSVFASDWPQWRGVDRTGHVPADAAVPTSISSEPKVVWRLEIGGGFSSPVVAGGKLVYLDGQGGQEVVHEVDANTGKEIWQLAFAEMFEDEWGPGPRSTPIIDGDRLYVQSCSGELRCLNFADGKQIWGASFSRDFNAPFLGNKTREGTATRRGNNGCGVIDGEQFIVPVGNTAGASIVSFNKMTGKVLWKTGDDEAAYSSYIVATLAGRQQIVVFTAEALMGLEPANGKVLWRVPLRTDAKRHAATPVILGDTVTVNSHTIGLACFKITKEGEEFKAAPAWINRDLKVNLATPVLVDHYFYVQGAGNDFVCVDALTGKQTWTHKPVGDTLVVSIVMGNNLLLTTDKGELFFIAANPTKYTELARAQISGKSWSHPAYANGKLYVREGLDRGWKLTCFDLMPVAP